jgi:hypothetical protein
MEASKMLGTISIQRNLPFVSMLALGVCIVCPSVPNAETIRSSQYFHPQFEHYFMTSDQTEMAALDAGSIGGWFRTGMFYQMDTEAKPGLVPVCRFFSTLGGKATHFFTAFADECTLVKSNQHWTFEGIAFYAQLPDAKGVCANGTSVVHRLYNNGRGGSPNHAYTPDASKRDLLIANGWISEGVAFCLPTSTDASLAKTQLLANTNWVFPLSEPAGCREDAPAYLYFSQPSPGREWPSTLPGAPTLDYLASVGAGGDNDCRLGVSGADEGFAGWDAGANQYIVWYTDGYGLYTLALFDRADLTTVPLCKVKLTANIDTRYATPRNLHPFQPELWSPCVYDTATRM